MLSNLFVPALLRLKKNPFLVPFQELSIHHKSYEVKIADQTDELFQALRLRFDVFFREFSVQKAPFSFFPYDLELHDLQCDHLIVKDKTTNKVIAAYRLLHSEALRSTYYSESEFEIEFIKDLPGNKLELGRACVDQNYRTGSVISLLWKGLLEYARRTNCSYMFGCSSVQGKSIQDFQTIQVELELRDAFLDASLGGALEHLRIEKFPEISHRIKHPASESKGLNSLMHMYVLAGAKFGRTPAYDKHMDCLDLFTLIDLTELPASFARKFSC